MGAMKNIKVLRGVETRSCDAVMRDPENLCLTSILTPKLKSDESRGGSL
jgi:hypothetical protein